MLGMGMKTINNTVLKIAMGLSWLQPRHSLLAIGDSSVVEVNVLERPVMGIILVLGVNCVLQLLYFLKCKV